MKLIISLVSIVALVFVALETQAFDSDTGEVWWDNYVSPMDLSVTYVEIQSVRRSTDSFDEEVGNGNSRHQADPGTLMEDAYTSESGLEEYHFFGGSSKSVDHTVVFCDGTGDYPKTAGFGFAWQECGNGIIFPPLPTLMGTILDGNELSVSVPFSGCFIVTFGIDGFDVGSWDYLVLADYDASGPVNPLAPTTDTFGGSKNTMALYDSATDGIGEGPSSARGWCFEVHP
jgi:hypothetical protein